MAGSETSGSDATAGAEDCADRVPPRRDLTPGALRLVTALLGAGLALALVAAVVFPGAAAGHPLHQSLAIVGAVLLLVPVAFSLVKRSGHAYRTPAWFSGHVVASSAGAILVTAHAAAGDLLSPPGLLWLLLVALLAQGLWARIRYPRPTAALFASRIDSFAGPDPGLRESLRAVIAAKRELLAELDPSADEALFSPDLRHALHHPWLTLRYARLAAREAHLVGRGRAGLALAFWRRAHIGLAVLFVVGLCIHMVMVLFLAGYVAAGEPVDWWHITAWGG